MPRKSRMSMPAGVALLVIALGCSSDPEVAILPPPPPCASSVEITVGSGTQPSLNWTPACTVAGVTVLEAQEETPAFSLWSVLAFRGFGPPIRIGITPPGADALTPEASLTPGRTYTVIVGGMEPGRGNGTLTFTARP